MPQPRLIHPIDVTIQIIDRDNSVFDPYAREPVGQVIRTGESPNTGVAYTFKAQVSFYYAGAKQDYPRYERHGVIEETEMYIATTYKILIAAGLMTLDTDGNFDQVIIKRGDRMIRWGREACNYFITGKKPFAHYPKQRQTMIQFNLSDRHPGYQDGDL
jgi:hypothetical protein